MFSLFWRASSEVHLAGVSGMAVTPDGRRAVSASDDHTLRAWDLETGKVLRTLEGHSAMLINGVAVTPDRRCAVSAYWKAALPCAR